MPSDDTENLLEPRSPEEPRSPGAPGAAGANEDHA